MTLVDSSGWIEFLADGPLARRFAPALRDPEKVLVPTLVIYEVVKRVRTMVGEAGADSALALLLTCRVAPLDVAVAVRAADGARERGLHMADAVIVATALEHGGVPVLTMDALFKGIEGATVIGS